MHYPGTYLAGVYNRVVSRSGDGDRIAEELVNVPNWLPFDIAVEDGRWWSEGGLAERNERRELDLRQGLLTRTVTLTATAGRVLRVVQRRLVSMDRPHLACLETTVTPAGWSGRISIRSGIDTAVRNANVIDPGEPITRHLGTPVIEHPPDTALAEVETTASKVRIAVTARTTLPGDSRTTWRMVAATSASVSSHSA